MKSKTSGQERKRNGQYGCGFDAVCRCGHTLGQHTAERPYDCLECEAAGEEHKCEGGFQKAAK